MRKLLLLIAVIFIGMNSMKAQETTPSSIIKVNPVGLIFGNFNATYEKALNEKSSVTIGANYFNWKAFGVSGYGLGAGYRFYFSKSTTAPEGLFVSPVLSLSSLSYDYKYDGSVEKQNVFSFGGGIEGGYQWVWNSGVALDLFAGYGYRAAKFKNYDASGGYPILGVAIGYAF